jgi:hypothetical protein
MRKFFFGCGIVMAAVVVTAAIGLFFLARDGAALDADSKTYVDNSVATIAQNWDADALWHLSSSRFRQVTKQEDLRRFFGAARGALGRLRATRGAVGQEMISIRNTVKMVTANYTVHAQFEKGDADIRISIIKNGSDWRIEGFHIDSAVLMRSLVGLQS